MPVGMQIPVKLKACIYIPRMSGLALRCYMYNMSMAEREREKVKVIWQLQLSDSHVSLDLWQKN